MYTNTFNSPLHFSIEATIVDIANNVKKLLLVQEIMSKEVVTLHYIRMDPWGESKRTKVEQHEFKESLAEFYDRKHRSDRGKLKCMILKKYFPYHEVRASHIWKYATRGVGLQEFRLNENDISSPRNGMLMCTSIEEAFDVKRLCFLVDKVRQHIIYVKVLDPSLMSMRIRDDHKSTFSDIDGKQLHHPDGKMPFRRILDWHAKCAYRSAISRSWIEASETFDDYFNLSIDSSIPDLHIYQDLM